MEKDECSRCQGKGEVGVFRLMARFGSTYATKKKCPKCGGSGKKGKVQ